VGYQAVDCVLWVNGSWDSLSPLQQTALDDYVAAGGHLVLFSGKDWQYLRSPGLAAMLPVTSIRSREVDSASGERMVLCLGDPIDQAESVISADGQVVGHRRPWGTGTVTLMAFCAEDSLGQRYRGDGQLWGQRVVQRSRLLAVAKETWEWRRSVEDALRQSQVYHIPPRAQIVWFLAAYIVALIPVNFLAFRWVRRPLYAWAASVGIAVSFAAWARQYEARTGSSDHVQVFNLAQVSPDGMTAEVKSYVAIFSPVSAEVTLDAAGEKSFFSLLESRPPSPTGGFDDGSRRGVSELLRIDDMQVIEHDGDGPGMPARITMRAKSVRVIQVHSLFRMSVIAQRRTYLLEHSPPAALPPRLPSLVPSLPERAGFERVETWEGPFLPLLVNGKPVVPVQEITQVYRFRGRQP
jgi:hypothetical protein